MQFVLQQIWNTTAKNKSIAGMTTTHIRTEYILEIKLAIFDVVNNHRVSLDKLDDLELIQIGDFVNSLLRKF